MRSTVEWLQLTGQFRRVATLGLAFFPVLFGGCATIFTGTSDRLSFDSNVPGVRLTIDGLNKGELPVSIEMSRGFLGGQQFIARFEKPGYLTQEFKLLRDFNVVAILDISSPLTSGGVDLLTGAFVKFSPTAYYLQMLPAEAGPVTSEQRRTEQLHRFALSNFRDLQRDLASGGGEHLATFSWLLASGDEAGSRRITEAALLAAPGLIRSPTAPGFVERFNELLERSPDLHVQRF